MNHNYIYHRFAPKIRSAYTTTKSQVSQVPLWTCSTNENTTNASSSVKVKVDYYATHCKRVSIWNYVCLCPLVSNWLWDVLPKSTLADSQTVEERGLFSITSIISYEFTKLSSLFPSHTVLCKFADLSRSAFIFYGQRNQSRETVRAFRFTQR